MVHSPSIVSFIALRDKIIAHNNPYDIHIMGSESHYNYEIHSRGGKIVWDDNNELLYFIHVNNYLDAMVDPISIEAIPYDNIRCLEEFCEEAV